MESYLTELQARLADGLARQNPELRERHARFLRARQNADGGFPGRDGDSDLYYTGFGLRGLAALDALTPEIGDHAANYLRGCLAKRASVVDLFSLLYACGLVQLSSGPDVLADSAADWPDRVAATLETFRTPDGGYNKSPGATAGSTYHTFLVALCYELLARPVPHGEELVRFVRARRRDDGGFVEVAPMRRSGTNPTAAGIGILQLIRGRHLPAEDVAPTVAFLAQMPGMDGGLRANDRVPLSDLLSTFTGCWTLGRLGALDRVDLRQIAEFAHAVELADGGFRGGLWDEATDVEYTFYGLGVLALHRKRMNLLVENLSKSFPTRSGELPVLRGINLAMAPGEALAVLGPSGSGKSTLLHLLGTLDRPTAGSYRLGGQDPVALGDAALARFRNRHIGFVFQEHYLLPQCSVLENVLIPTLAGGTADRSAAERRARDLLGRVGLSERLDHRPAELSGGERQRVAVARAVLLRPALLLADEPTGNLDRTTAAWVGQLLLDVHREENTILIVVTHSIELAEMLPKRMEMLDGTLVPWHGGRS